MSLLGIVFILVMFVLVAKAICETIWGICHIILGLCLYAVAGLFYVIAKIIGLVEKLRRALKLKQQAKPKQVKKTLAEMMIAYSKNEHK